MGEPVLIGGDNQRTTTITPIVSEETLGLIGRYIARKLDRMFDTPVLFLVIEEGAKQWAHLLAYEYWQQSNTKPQTVSVKASSYEGQKSSGRVKMQIDETSSSILRATAFGSRPVVIVEDVIETGRTMEAVVQYLVDIGFPEEKIIVASMLYKHPLGYGTSRICDETIHVTSHAVPAFVGLEMDTHMFVVGFGLDLDGEYRDLPFIGVIKKD